MKYPSHLYLAALINKFPEDKIIGRKRLQKIVRLLQSIPEFPTDYSFRMHFYGPYSEGLQVELSMLEQFQYIKETKEEKIKDNSPYYVIESQAPIEIEEISNAISNFEPQMNAISKYETDVLEITATFIGFLESGFSPDEAKQRLIIKKGKRMCKSENLRSAKELLEALKIRVEEAQILV